MKLRHFTLLMTLAVSLFTRGQGNIHERSSEYEWPADSAVMNKLRLWQDQKFGILLHWDYMPYPESSSRGPSVMKTGSRATPR